VPRNLSIRNILTGIAKRRQIGARVFDFSFGKIIPGDHPTPAEREMHLMTSLIVIFGFTIVLCLALVKVIGDLSKMSVHAPPDILAMQCGMCLTPELEHADTTEVYETSIRQ